MYERICRNDRTLPPPFDIHHIDIEVYLNEITNKSMGLFHKMYQWVYKNWTQPAMSSAQFYQNMILLRSPTREYVET